MLYSRGSVKRQRTVLSAPSFCTHHSPQVRLVYLFNMILLHSSQSSGVLQVSACTSEWSLLLTGYEPRLLSLPTRRLHPLGCVSGLGGSWDWFGLSCVAFSSHSQLLLICCCTHRPIASPPAVRSTPIFVHGVFTLCLTVHLVCTPVCLADCPQQRPLCTCCFWPLQNNIFRLAHCELIPPLRRV